MVRVEEPLETLCSTRMVFPTRRTEEETRTRIVFRMISPPHIERAGVDIWIDGGGWRYVRPKDLTFKF